MEEGNDTLVTDAEVRLFGHSPRPARARIRVRSRSWRLGGALRRLAGGAVLAPFAAIVPPHAPWAIGALGVGALLARRRWHERFTLAGVEGSCPRCGAELSARGGRLRAPHPLTCDGCRHGLQLVVEDADLEPDGAAG